MMDEIETLVATAYKQLLNNDRGGYTVPTNGLYPFQWNWDSCLTALGFSYFDERRAWQEINTLFANQWPDGMVPHIIFHKEDAGYFPGPEIWQTKRTPPTSGITQPPVAGLVVHQLFKRAKDRSAAEKQVRMLLPKILAWHEWFYTCRDPQKTGLVAILHPWESGRDNSIDWDQPFEFVPTDGVMAYQRRDTQHANPDHRPTKAQYDRYIWLLQNFRALGWDNQKSHDASPFQVVDPGFNAILIRSSFDMAKTALSLNEPKLVECFTKLGEQGAEALETLWSEQFNQYLCYDRAQQCFIESPSIGGLIPILANCHHSKDIARHLHQIGKHCRYLVPSHDPLDPKFDGARYWRGPVWLIVNYLIYLGLKEADEHELANRLLKDSIALIQHFGFSEYYNPITGAPCGGSEFTWTAAMVIEFLKNP